MRHFRSMIPMGAGEASKVACQQLHRRLESALSLVSGMQQCPMSTDQITKEEWAQEIADGNQELISLSKDILSALGVTAKEFKVGRPHRNGPFTKVGVLVVQLMRRGRNEVADFYSEIEPYQKQEKFFGMHFDGMDFWENDSLKERVCERIAWLGRKKEVRKKIDHFLSDHPPFVPKPVKRSDSYNQLR